MNKTKKNGTLSSLKIILLSRGHKKESLKQSMMIEKQRAFARNSLLLECILSVFDSRWYPGISLYSPLYPCLLEEYQKPSTFASSDLTECPMHKGEFFISKQSNYDDKRITGQTCLADDRRGFAFPCTTRQYVHKWRNSKGINRQRKKQYVYGLAEIARLFGRRLPKVNRIKQGGKFNRAITQVGCKIIVEAELALELAGRKTGGRWWIPVGGIKSNQQI